MRKPVVLLITFLLLCASSGVALFFLFSSPDAKVPAAPGMKPAPRTRTPPSVGKNAREAFVLVIRTESERMILDRRIPGRRIPGQGA